MTSRIEINGLSFEIFDGLFVDERFCFMVKNNTTIYELLLDWAAGARELDVKFPSGIQQKAMVVELTTVDGLHFKVEILPL